MLLGHLPRKKILQTSTGRLEYVLSGDGEFALVLLNGAGVPLEGWSRLYPDIERIGRVLAWNRRGLGASSMAGAATGAAVLGELRQLLAQLQVPPPYLLVGHSLGALYAQLFARRHPGEVMGVVLIEPAQARDGEQLQSHEGRLASILGRLLSVPKRMLRANLHAELEQADALGRELEAAGAFPAVPLVVVSGGQRPPRWVVSEQELRAKRARQQALVRLSPMGEQVLARRSGHFPQLTQPELVLEVLRRVADSGREALVEHVRGQQVQDAGEHFLELAHR